MALHISVTTASAALKESAIVKAITQLATHVVLSSRAGLIPEHPILDVTFLLPGALDKPSFSGMRMGGYQPGDATLYFEKAVPEHILHSSQSPEFVSSVLFDVIDNASDFFQEHNLPFDQLNWVKLANLLAANSGQLPGNVG